MDIEQLKLILEALGEAGDGAKTIALWWLICPLINTVLCWIGGLLLVSIIADTARRLLSPLQFAAKVGRRLGVAEDWDGSYDERDCLRKIDALIKKKGE